MGKDDFERGHGRGHLLRDLGHVNSKTSQLKAVLAARITGVLDAREMSVRRAHDLTGFVAADFSRVRQARFSRFTIDRRVAMLDRLDQDVEMAVSVPPIMRFSMACDA